MSQPLVCDDTLCQVTWACVHFLSAQQADEAVAGAPSVHHSRADCATVREPAQLFQLLQQAMGFPLHFGHNWDAVLDSLRDLSWLGPARGHALRLDHADELWRAAPRTAGALVDVWLTAAEEWADENHPFHLIFVC